MFFFLKNPTGTGNRVNSDFIRCVEACNKNPPIHFFMLIIALLLPLYHAEVDCGHPGIPPHAVMSGEKFTFGSTVRYSCLGDHQLIGDSSLTCQLNGHWSGPLPHCSGTQIHRNLGVHINRGSPEHIQAIKQ